MAAQQNTSSSGANNPGAQSEYMLPRGWRESVRLDRQHGIIVKRVGWSLHPRIQEVIKANENDANFKVADLATGTGVCALEIHEQFPKVSITALDVSDAQFPPPWLVPSTVKFGTLDLLGDIPDEYVGAFDVIHLKFIAVVLGRGGKEKVVTNLHRLLKPGGWLQWHEFPLHAMLVAEPGQAVFRRWQNEFENVYFALWDKQEMESFERLDEVVLTHADFTDVEAYRPPVRLSMVAEESRWAVAAIASLRDIMGGSVPEDLYRATDHMATTVEESFRRGRQYAYTLIIVTARKPE